MERGCAKRLPSPNALLLHHRATETATDSTIKQNNEQRRCFTILKVSGFHLVASGVTDRFHVLQLRPRLPYASPLQAAVLEVVPAGAWVTHTPICVLVLDRNIAYIRWRGAVTGKSFGLAIGRSQVQILLGATLRNNLRQVVYTYVPLSPSSITWYWPKGGDALRLGR